MKYICILSLLLLIIFPIIGNTVLAQEREGISYGEYIALITADVKFSSSGSYYAVLSEEIHMRGSLLNRTFILTIYDGDGELIVSDNVEVDIPVIRWCGDRFIIIGNSKIYLFTNNSLRQIHINGSVGKLSDFTCLPDNRLVIVNWVSQEYIVLLAQHLHMIIKNESKVEEIIKAIPTHQVIVIEPNGENKVFNYSVGDYGETPNGFIECNPDKDYFALALMKRVYIINKDFKIINTFNLSGKLVKTILDKPFALLKTPARDILVFAVQDSSGDIFIEAFDINGDIIWRRKMGFNNKYDIYNIKFSVTADGKYLAYMEEHLSGKSYIVVLDPNGQILWVRSVPNHVDYIDIINLVKRSYTVKRVLKWSPDNRSLAISTSWFDIGYANYCVKIDVYDINGEIIWSTPPSPGYLNEFYWLSSDKILYATITVYNGDSVCIVTVSGKDGYSLRKAFNIYPYNGYRPNYFYTDHISGYPVITPITVGSKVAYSPRTGKVLIVNSSITNRIVSNVYLYGVRDESEKKVVIPIRSSFTTNLIIYNDSLVLINLLGLFDYLEVIKISKTRYSEGLLLSKEITIPRYIMYSKVYQNKLLYIFGYNGSLYLHLTSLDKLDTKVIPLPMTNFHKVIGYDEQHMYIIGFNESPLTHVICRVDLGKGVVDRKSIINRSRVYALGYTGNEIVLSIKGQVTSGVEIVILDKDLNIVKNITRFKVYKIIGYREELYNNIEISSITYAGYISTTFSIEGDSIYGNKMLVTCSYVQDTESAMELGLLVINNDDVSIHLLGIKGRIHGDIVSYWFDHGKYLVLGIDCYAILVYRIGDSVSKVADIDIDYYINDIYSLEYAEGFIVVAEGLTNNQVLTYVSKILFDGTVVYKKVYDDVFSYVRTRDYIVLASKSLIIAVDPDSGSEYTWKMDKEIISIHGSSVSNHVAIILNNSCSFNISIYNIDYGELHSYIQNNNYLYCTVEKAEFIDDKYLVVVINSYEDPISKRITIKSNTVLLDSVDSLEHIRGLKLPVTGAISPNTISSNTSGNALESTSSNKQIGVPSYSNMIIIIVLILIVIVTSVYIVYRWRRYSR